MIDRLPAKTLLREIKEYKIACKNVDNLTEVGVDLTNSVLFECMINMFAVFLISWFSEAEINLILSYVSDDEDNKIKNDKELIKVLGLK